MTTLKQIWKENGSLYKTPLVGSPLFQESDIRKWLQQKLEEHENHFWWKWVINELLEELENES